MSLPHPLRLLAFCTAFLALVCTDVRPAAAQLFQSAAPQAILYDVGTGSVLYERNADELIPPASLAKLMTVEVLFNAMREGQLTLDSEITISENAWRRGGAPSGGSTMFAALGSRVKIADIIPGIVVLSGNDACIAVAEALAGDEATFGKMMTARARKIGLTRSVFTNPTGLPDPGMKVTAREIAMLSDHLIRTYPEYYHYFGLKDFTWNKIRQSNRNPLLGMDIGADGLKTGETDEAGFALAGSAVQDGRRLIVVVSGLKSGRERATEARKLLEWGFRAFEKRQLFAAGETVGEASVYGGEKGRVALRSKGVVSLLLPRGSTERLAARIVYRGPLIVPVQEGAEVARLVVTRGDIKTLDIPLYAAESVQAGSLQSRALDALFEATTGWVRKALNRS